MSLRFVLASSLIAAPALAQGNALPLDRVGLFTDDHGVLRGIGPAYRAAFEPGLFELVPAFGARVPEVVPVAFELLSYGREQGAPRTAQPAAPTAAGRLVSFDHGAAVERYELVREGIEQSFLFPEPLPGAGDLVVRGRVTTSLLPPADGDYTDGVRYELPGVGGVEWGGVTGVSADGARSPGSLRVTGDVLELVLPAAFVDGASYPLLLDPLIGGAFDVGPVADADRSQPDVAWDASFDEYCVTWHTDFSESSAWVMVQRFSASGAPLAGAVAVDSTGLNREPTIANVTVANRYVVAWHAAQSAFVGGPWYLKTRLVSASTGALSNELFVTPFGENAIDADLAGEAAFLDNEALVVWERVGEGIFAQQINVPIGSADPSLFGAPVQLAGTGRSHPAISKSGGAFGRYLIAWEVENSGPFHGDSQLRFTLVDQNLAFLGDPVYLPVDARAIHDVDVDGDGERWAIVYESEEFTGSALRDVRSRTIEWTGGSPVIEMHPEVVLSTGLDHMDPAVAWIDDRMCVAFSRQAQSLTYRLYYASYDPDSGVACEPEQLVSSKGINRHAAIASQRSGDPSSGTEALLVWTQYDLSPPFDGDLFGQLVDAVGPDGTAQEVGPACGGGGTCTAIGPPNAGNTDFAIGLQGADPLATSALLNLAPPGPTFDCGTCAISIPLILFGRPVAGGAASQPLPIPCDATLIGMTVEAQWIAVIPTLLSPCPLIGNASSSSRLALTIGG